jgi:hypothetical protein
MKVANIEGGCKGGKDYQSGIQKCQLPRPITSKLGRYSAATVPRDNLAREFNISLSRIRDTTGGKFIFTGRGFLQDL